MTVGVFKELISPSETLMKWREPNAYSRRDLSGRGWISLAAVLAVPVVFVMLDSVALKVRMILATLFVVLGLAVFLRVWFGLGDTVCLKEEHISRGAGDFRKRTRYRDFRCCNVRRDSYRGMKFCVLKFKLRAGLPAGQVEQVVVPDDADCDRVLHFLRDKGVKVVEEPLPA